MNISWSVSPTRMMVDLIIVLYGVTILRYPWTVALLTVHWPAFEGVWHQMSISGWFECATPNQGIRLIIFAFVYR